MAPLRRALQALPITILALLLSCWETGVSAENSQHSDQPRKASPGKEARGVGRYIAEGFGLEAQANESTIPSSTLNSTSSSLPESSTTYLAPSISANGTINSYALSCYSARYTWRQSYNAWFSTAVEGRSFSTSSFTTTQQIQTVTTATIYPTSVSTYKLCDGSPRVDASPVTLTSTYNWTTTFTTVVTPSSPTFEPPPCSMSAKDCMYLYYNTSLSNDEDDVVLLGACGSPAHLGLPCLIGGGPVRLAYFPVSTTNGDLCKGDGTTITSMTGPTTIEALGTTLTSGSVYLSFQSLYAYQEGFDIRIGPNFTDYIMALPSSAVSTQCGGWFSAQGNGTAVNWADFNYPQPASAYACENRCTTELSYIAINGTGHRYTPPPECYTIWDDFNPALAVPTEARALVPEWSTCSFWDAALPNFLFDPPIALRPAGAIASATLPGTSQSTAVSASPASTSYTALPEETRASTATTLSTSPESSGGGAGSSASTNIQAVQLEFTAGTQVFTASAATGAAAHNAFVVDGVTIPVGGPAEVVDGHTLSLGINGFVVDGSSAVQMYSSSLGSAMTVTTTASSSSSADDGGGGSGGGDGDSTSTSPTARGSSTTSRTSAAATSSSPRSTSTKTSGAASRFKTSLPKWLLTPLMSLFAIL